MRFSKIPVLILVILAASLLTCTALAAEPTGCEHTIAEVIPGSGAVNMAEGLVLGEKVCVGPYAFAVGMAASDLLEVDGQFYHPNCELSPTDPTGADVVCTLPELSGRLMFFFDEGQTQLVGLWLSAGSLF